MADSRSDFGWGLGGSPARNVSVHDELRYSQGAGQTDLVVDGVRNFHWLMSPAELSRPKVLLEAGINAPAEVVDCDGFRRRPLIAIRSSPWKAGSSVTPWHDEFDLDHGHIRYFGDHKPTTLGLPGSTRGNRLLLETAKLHAGTSTDERAAAPPLLVFRAITVYRDGRAVHKGYVEFCGVAIIETLEHVVQRDPESGRSYPNLALDLAIVAGGDDDEFDMRWIDDRRDPTLAVKSTLRHAPLSWRKWVKGGRTVLPGIRRRVLAGKVKTAAEQLPEVGSRSFETLSRIHSFYDGRKHAFEMLAARVAAHVLQESGARYREGWLSRSSGDGGVDFIGRIDFGATGATMPVVVLGQAKCVAPSSSVSAEQVARLVARLRRGWIGVYVITGTFSRQAQVEIIDDQYPLVMISGRVLTEAVERMVQESYGGVLEELLDATVKDYGKAITYRRPEEIIAT